MQPVKDGLLPIGIKQGHTKSAGFSTTPSRPANTSASSGLVSVVSQDSRGEMLASSAPNYAMVESPSMILIDQSSELLLGTMRELKDLSPDTVNALCNTAKAITNLLRLKLDVIKFQRQCEKE